MPLSIELDLQALPKPGQSQSWSPGAVASAARLASDYGGAAIDS
jgi:hypothetical protein